MEFSNVFNATSALDYASSAASAAHQTVWGVIQRHPYLCAAAALTTFAAAYAAKTAWRWDTKVEAQMPEKVSDAAPPPESSPQPSITMESILFLIEAGGDDDRILPLVDKVKNVTVEDYLRAESLGASEKVLKALLEFPELQKIRDLLESSGKQ